MNDYCDPASPAYSRIMYYSLTDPPVYEGPKSQFDSLRTLLQSILECYQKGIYYFENFDGIILASKARLAIEVFIKNNPKSDYWKSE